MKQKRYSDDFTFKLLEAHEGLHEMGYNISDERFEDTLVQGTANDNELLMMTSFHSPNFCIDEIQTTTRT